jgi:hypothetical protein
VLQPERQTLLRRTTKTAPSTVHEVKLDEEAERAQCTRRAILCAKCRHRVTGEEQRIEVGGSHTHRFFNPHGFLFHIGCFRQASGCGVRGAPTMEFTWFPGFAWSYALCGECGEHLGWCFQSMDSRFFGLVLNRLISESTH